MYIENNLSVSAPVYIENNLSVSAPVYIENNLSVSAPVYIENNLSVSASVYIENNLSVSAPEYTCLYYELSNRIRLCVNLDILKTIYPYPPQCIPGYIENYLTLSAVV